MTENEPPMTIDRVDLGTGRVCFQGGENPPPPDQLPFFLTDAIESWQNQNPEFKIRNALPTVVGGNTVAVHLWFD